LYDGVIHRRALALIEKKYVLIIDELESVDGREHEYDQMFHFNPDLKAQMEGLDVIGYDKDGSDKKVAIHQLESDGISASLSDSFEGTPRAICSKKYESYVPCYEVDYKKRGRDSRFVTLLEIVDGTDDKSDFYVRTENSF